MEPGKIERAIERKFYQWNNRHIQEGYCGDNRNAIQNQWNSLKYAILESAKESIGYRKKLKTDERRRWEIVNTEKGRKMYTRRNNQLRREADMEKENWWNVPCKELEELDKKAGQTCSVLEYTISVARRRKRRQENILSREGILRTKAPYTAHLEDFISSCPTCHEFQNQQRKETLIPHHMPLEVWCKVGTDLFTLRNKDYLIVADYNTKFFEVTELPNALASTVVSKTKNIFARFGIPKTVISDNEP